MGFLVAPADTKERSAFHGPTKTSPRGCEYPRTPAALPTVLSPRAQITELVAVPPTRGSRALTQPAPQADGSPAVLKVYLHDEPGAQQYGQRHQNPDHAWWERSTWVGGRASLGHPAVPRFPMHRVAAVAWQVANTPFLILYKDSDLLINVSRVSGDPQIGITLPPESIIHAPLCIKVNLIIS